MFIFFQENKRNWKKGQVIPILLVVLIAIIMMSMVTINLSKVASTKVDVANSVDAGALAGASSMAGVFNQQAQMNSAMEASYWENYALLVSSAAVIGIDVGAAMILCATIVGIPAAILLFNAARVATYALIASTQLLAFKQYNLYRNMKKIAKQGRSNAIQNAYRYAFYNSGIGNKLISRSIFRDILGGEKRGSVTNYADTFNTFLRSGIIKLGVDLPLIPYGWVDGQGRDHLVTVEAYTKPVTNYQMKVTVLPVQVLETYLLDAATGMNCLLASYALMDLGIYAGGLLPGYTAGAAGGGVTLFYCWVNEIIHPHTFIVGSTQNHGAKNYEGLWKAEYPVAVGGCVANFEGKGRIYPPRARFDSSIQFAK